MVAGGIEAIGAGAAAGGEAEVAVLSGVGAAVVVVVVGTEMVFDVVDVDAATRPGPLDGDAQPPSKSVSAPARAMPVPTSAVKRFFMFPY
ncbi:hypothetical protein [Nocardia nepalensis]|uniref:hypothetical protein n=1 Tax=Nocardia nepalensis TaxID=3375448 RepID=UPI003B66D6A8